MAGLAGLALTLGCQSGTWRWDWWNRDSAPPAAHARAGDSESKATSDRPAGSRTPTGSTEPTPLTPVGSGSGNAAGNNNRTSATSGNGDKGQATASASGDSSDRQRLPPAPAGSVLPTVLTLNRDTITIDDILEPIRPQLEKASQTMGQEEYYTALVQIVRRQLIEDVSERLVWQEAEREVNKEENRKQLDSIVDRVEQDRINRDFGGRESRYEKHLAESKKSREDVRQRIRRQIVVEQYLRDRLIPRIAVRKKDLQRYYESNINEFSDIGRLELFMIDVPIATFLEPGRPPTEAELMVARKRAREQADGALAKIRAGQSFDAVARSDSRGLQRDAGGSWGMISSPLRGRYEEPSKRAFKMAPNQVSEVLEAPTGYFIVKTGRVEPTRVRPFEEVQRDIVAKLEQKQFSELRSQFLQRTLERAAIGDLEPFVRGIVARAPESARVNVRSIERSTTRR